jgi:hypothetical protein
MSRHRPTTWQGLPWGAGLSAGHRRRGCRAPAPECCTSAAVMPWHSSASYNRPSVLPAARCGRSKARTACGRLEHRPLPTRAAGVRCSTPPLQVATPGGDPPRSRIVMQVRRRARRVGPAPPSRCRRHPPRARRSVSSAQRYPTPRNHPTMMALANHGALESAQRRHMCGHQHQSSFEEPVDASAFHPGLSPPRGGARDGRPRWLCNDAGREPMEAPRNRRTTASRERY